MQGVPGTSRRLSKSLIVVASCPSMWIMDVSYFVISGTRVCSHWAGPHDTLSLPPRLFARLALVPCGNYRQQVRGHSLVLAPSSSILRRAKAPSRAAIRAAICTR